MNAAKVCILDYGSGNVRSVYNIVSYLHYDVEVSNSTESIKAATHIILPGVGAFGAAMEKIRSLIPLHVLEEVVREEKKPFLGICVGMQVLADKGYEHGEHAGLGWIPGEVKRLQTNGLALPHIGWNDISFDSAEPLFKKFAAVRGFYFVHSFAFDACDSGHVAAEAEYGQRFAAAVRSDNIYGVQFHPEKSQKAGQLLLKNFFDLS